MMKTLHLTNAWHESSGGVSTFYRALLKAAAEREQQIRLVVPGPADRVESAGPFGLIYYVRSPQAPCRSGYRFIPPYAFLSPRGTVAAILRAERPDLVEINDKYTLNCAAGLLRLGALPGVKNRPVVVGLSCERLDETVAAYLFGGRFARWLSRRYMKWLYFPMCDHHIAVSWHTASELQLASRGHRVSRAVWVRPMGVDAGLMSPARRSQAIREELLSLVRGDSQTVLLLYVGRLAPEKNLGLLVNTLVGLPENYRLLIAGNGPLAGDLSRQAAAFGSRVAFLGHVSSREGLADVYANCDVFVHTNPREPFGIAPLEAMASGLPLVAPLTGGLRAYANPGNAWLAEPEPDSFAAAVVSAASASPERGARTAAARLTAERYNWPFVCAGYLDLYAEIYALFQHSKPPLRHKPDFVSTPGDWFGREPRTAQEASCG